MVRRRITAGRICERVSDRASERASVREGELQNPRVVQRARRSRRALRSGFANVSSPSPVATVVGIVVCVASRSRRVTFARQSTGCFFRCPPVVSQVFSKRVCARARARVVERSFKEVDVGNREESSSKGARMCGSVDDTVVSVLLDGPAVAAASL